MQPLSLYMHRLVLTLACSKSLHSNAWTCISISSSAGFKPYKHSGFIALLGYRVGRVVAQWDGLCASDNFKKCQDLYPYLIAVKMTLSFSSYINLKWRWNVMQNSDISMLHKESSHFMSDVRETERERRWQAAKITGQLWVHIMSIRLAAKPAQAL